MSPTPTPSHSHTTDYTSSWTASRRRRRRPACGGRRGDLDQHGPWHRAPHDRRREAAGMFAEVLVRPQVAHRALGARR
eukprot:1464001-Prymnesium_polylepis.1